MENKKSLLTILIFVGLAGQGLAGNHAGAQTPSVAAQMTLGGIEPQAGTWKPWVLATGRELRLPPPPDAAATRAEIEELRSVAAQRDAAARHRITFWDAGAPSYRWVELALERILQGPVWGLNAARFVSLINVAMYDATIAVWDSKYAYNRRRPGEFDPSLATALPNPRSPSYPSEHAATAGAASTVLAYLFPEDARRFTDQAVEATQSRLLAGVEYPTDIQAGLELGRAVATRVIQRAKEDGFDTPWNGCQVRLLGDPAFSTGSRGQDPLPHPQPPKLSRGTRVRLGSDRGNNGLSVPV